MSQPLSSSLRLKKHRAWDWVSCGVVESRGCKDVWYCVLNAEYVSKWMQRGFGTTTTSKRLLIPAAIMHIWVYAYTIFQHYMRRGTFPKTPPSNLLATRVCLNLPHWGTFFNLARKAIAARFSKTTIAPCVHGEIRRECTQLVYNGKWLLFPKGRIVQASFISIDYSPRLGERRVHEWNAIISSSSNQLNQSEIIWPQPRWLIGVEWERAREREIQLFALRFVKASLALWHVLNPE